ncbi:hypothetical protein Q5P01_004339 [Channa striata]|uniref:Enhancer of polycomb C-terminal domain-containing protein n=1 Tax=Channa striata TaxID=64152 RepID=A0AA88NIQ3_CHASR|nr:hypothetical protein Q5P01_004339 [Channa striata]
MGSAPTPVNVFTAEQYQQHQEQLALMHKQQLEQSQQQQQQANNSATTTNTQALVSKTLNQANAQFAASALITTDQILAFKSKEEPVLPSGVNGILPGSGVFKQVLTNQSTHTTTSAAPTFLQPSSNSATPSPASALPTSLSSNPSAHAAATAPQQLGLLGCSAANTPPTTQVLIGNNICLSVPSAASLAGRHIPRTLGNVPPTALKLSAATNLQIPKVSGASSMDMSSRENHDEDKPALNSIADNTVAMEVT